MSDLPLLNAAGRRRSPAAIPGFLNGRIPANKGRRYPPDPPRPEEIVRVMRQAGETPHGLRLRALIAVLWRGGLRIAEALALTETDVDQQRGALVIRHGKGDRRREVGMDDWGFEHLDAWLIHRVQMPVGPLLCVIAGPTCGRPWSASAARTHLRTVAAEAGVRRRFAPHQLRHGLAVELAREGVPVNIIQRQLGHYVGDPVKGKVGRPGDGGVGGRVGHVVWQGDHDACWSRRCNSPSKIFSRPTWPLSAASSCWRWRVGRNSCVV